MQPDAALLGAVAGPVASARSQAGLLAQAGALLDTLERLLTSAFPVAAPVPAAALLLLITRVLSVDDVGTGAHLHPRDCLQLGASSRGLHRSSCTGFDGSSAVHAKAIC